MYGPMLENNYDELEAISTSAIINLLVSLYGHINAEDGLMNVGATAYYDLFIYPLGMIRGLTVP